MFEGLPRDKETTPIVQASTLQLRAHDAATARMARMGRPVIAPVVVSPAQWCLECPNTPRGRLRPVVIDHPFPWLRSVSRGPPTIRQIQYSVARYFEVSVVDMLARRRVAAVTLPRHVAMYLARHLTLSSSTEIGRRFGNMDHTTVLNAVSRIDRLRRANPDLSAQLCELERMLAPEG